MKINFNINLPIILEKTYIFLKEKRNWCMIGASNFLKDHKQIIYLIYVIYKVGNILNIRIYKYILCNTECKFGNLFLT